MNRRALIVSALGLTATSLARLLAAPPARRPARAAPAKVVQLQTSPLAGSQYHVGEAVWPSLAAGQPLRLARERANPYDAKAVPRRLARPQARLSPARREHRLHPALDRGERLSARIDALERSPDPWRRIQIAAHLEIP